MPGTVRSIVVGGGVRATGGGLGDYVIFADSDSPPGTIGPGNAENDGSTPPRMYLGTVQRATNVDGFVTLAGGARIIQDDPSALHHIVIGHDTLLDIDAAPPVGNECLVIGADCSIVGTTQLSSIVAIGHGITTPGFTSVSGAILIGCDITCNTASPNSPIVIGTGATFSVASSSDVLIGTSADRSGTSGSNSVGIGGGVSVRESGCTVVGGGSIAQGRSDVVLGSASATNTITAFGENIVVGTGSSTSTTTQGAIVIGCNTDALAAGSGSIYIGTRITPFLPASRSFTVGTAGSGLGIGNVSITNMQIGGVDTEAGYPGLTWRCVNGSGTNNSVGSLTIIAPRPTGNIATGINVGGILFQTPVTGASGAVVQTVRNSFGIASSGTAADTDILVYDVDNAQLERVSVGAADSGGLGFKVLRIPN